MPTLNHISEFGNTPLIHAALGAHADVVSLLLQRGADVNAVDRGGFSALHCAACFDRSGRCVGAAAVRGRRRRRKGMGMERLLCTGRRTITERKQCAICSRPAPGRTSSLGEDLGKTTRHLT